MSCIVSELNKLLTREIISTMEAIAGAEFEYAAAVSVSKAGPA